MACHSCGAVIVGHGPGDYEPGASLQEWAKDLYEAGKKQEEKPLPEEGDA